MGHEAGWNLRGKSRWILSSLGLVILASCGGDPVTPTDQLALQAQSDHFSYHYASGDWVDTGYQERHFTWALAKLELEYGGKVEFHKYRDQGHLKRVTGRSTNGFAEPNKGRFHTIWPQDNHEYLHIVFVTLVGSPPAFFSEGVAVAHHGASISGDFEGPPLWNGASAHSLARGFLLSGSLPDRNDLLVTNRFWDLDQQVTYPIAGSFVRFLIDGGGIEPFKDFCSAAGRDDSLARIERGFEDVYGEPFQKWWDRWQDFIRNQ
jgi:hypothetical protein